MTVGKMRRLMLNKIVPEKVIPQNIVDFLMDEKAELAEIDAFTFFKRLRDLGVGSADFIYLLEGCGAPEEAVLKIKSNPAMTLQGLIRTVEGAGMTSKDYMRILYTARQIWEHTLTSRLEMMESDMLMQNTPEEAPAESTDSAEPIENLPEPDEFKAAFDAVVEENKSKKSSETRVPDSTTGFYLGETEEFENLLSGLNNQDSSAAVPDNTHPAQPSVEDDSDAEIAGSDEIIEEYLDEQNTITPASPEDLKKETKNFTVEIDYNEENTESAAEDSAADLTFETVPDAAEDNSGDASAGYNGDTTSIFKIDRTMLEENLANIARNAGSPDPSDSDDDVAPPERDEAPIDDRYDEDYDYVHRKSRYYKGALIAASIGAAVVLGAGTAAGMLFGMEPVKPIGYAADENEIFSEIYYAHEAKTPGGDSFYSYGLQDLTVFGDLLVERNGFGTYTDGNHVYTLTNEQITINEFSGGEISYVGTIEPPENTVFADVSQLSDGAVIAAFDGESCGYIKVSDGESVYTVKQDGSLTDFYADDSEVRIGSVYTPKFYTTFNASNKEIYLPKIGVEYTPIAPQKVVPSRTPGYSYGVAGAYSVESGMTLRADAVLGNPVYASGDGIFAVNSEESGKLIRTDYTNVTPDTPTPKVITLDCGKLVNAAFYQNGSAIFENGSIVIRDKELKTQSMLRNFSSLPEYMRFSGDTLLAADKEKVFLTVDCSNLAAPNPVELKIVRGRVGNGRAVIQEQTAEGLRTASYKLDDSGKAAAEYEYIAQIPNEQRSTLKFGSAAAIVADENLCGAAYSFFDGVSVVSEYVRLGSSVKRVTLYDDKTGFDIAFAADPADGKIYAHCSKGLIEIEN